MSNADKKRELGKFETGLLSVMAVTLAAFHILSGLGVIVLSGYAMAAILWAFVASYFVISKFWIFKGSEIIKYLFVAIIVASSVTLLILYPQLAFRPGTYTQFEIIIAVASVITAIIIGYKALGKALPIIGALFLIYTMFGSHIKGMFKTTRMTVTRLATYLFTGTEGTFGTALITCAKFIYLFVLFGAFLELTGAGEFFVKLSFAIMGRIKGGPAQAAVYSSMLMGMVSGSGPANVVTTGTFTIPLMKRTGFDPNTAGAVEAVASNGGQIMPPVMGAVAFLMSDATGIPYGQICLCALVPAVLYYLTLSACIVSYSYKHDIPVVDERTESIWSIFKSGWFFFLPIVSIVVLLVMGYSAQRCAVISILVAIVIGVINDRKKMSIKNIIKALNGAISSMSGVAIACFLAGIVTGCINITGLGIKISNIIQALSGGHLFLMLILTMFVCIILGMGLPTSAAYIILAVMIAPSIISFGVNKIAAHMFILYFGTISNLTPPVALAVFAACSISGGTMWKTGGQAMKLAATAFVVPFIFVYSNELLLMGETKSVILALITAFAGCILLGFSLFGWLFKDLNVVERFLLLVAAISLMLPRPLLINAIGAGVAAVVVALALIESKKKKRVVG